MNKTLFTESEIANIISTLGNQFDVSVNKAGNIKVFNIEEHENHSCWGKVAYGFWVLYKFENGTFLWRRHDGTGYCYPLNMKGRKFEGKVTKVRNRKTGKMEYWGYKPYTTSMSVFNTFEEAMNYFVKYLNKYRGITL